MSLQVKVVKDSERERFNRFVITSPWAHFKQLYEWGDVLGYEGIETIRLGVERDGVLCASLSISIRPIPGCRWTFLTAPRGPILDFKDHLALACLLDGVREIAKGARAIFLRVDPECPDEDQGVRQGLGEAGFVHLKKNWSSVSDPRVGMGLRLTASESELIQAMRASHRQNIRGFARSGITLRDAREHRDVVDFHRLWMTVGERRGFPVRNVDYYVRVWTFFIQHGRGRLLLAEKDHELVAGLLILSAGQKAWILHSGLTSAARKLKPNEAIWWEAIRWAKQQGATVCDFGGSGTDWPPQADAPGYPVFFFKRGFRAEAVYLTGYYDFVFMPALYSFFRFAEEHLVERAPWFLRLLRGRVQ